MASAPLRHISLPKRDSHGESLVSYLGQTPENGANEADMTAQKNRPAIGALLFFGVAFALASIFTFAAVQGDYGLFRRVEVEAEKAVLKEDLAQLRAEVARMENLTQRLSDDYLDLDLLDQQARDVLGMIRADEIVIQ
jgi:cell division protein FtsB